MSSADFALHDKLTGLYREHHQWLTGWLRRRVRCRDQAQDLAQDTFVRVLRARSATDIREPRDYLSTIAKGLVIDWYRKRALERAYLDVLAMLLEAEMPSLEAQSVWLEALAEIDRMLDGLNPRVRKVFLLSQLDGFTYAEIAARLGVSKRTINSDMALAMMHCAQCLP